MYYGSNCEGYRDPTACLAIGRVYGKEKRRRKQEQKRGGIGKYEGDTGNGGAGAFRLVWTENSGNGNGVLRQNEQKGGQENGRIKREENVI